MLNLKKIALAGVLVLGLANTTQAQEKFGYIDEMYILNQMPEYKKANAEIEEYQKQIKIELESKKKTYEEKIKAIEAINKPETPPSLLEAKAKEISELERQMQELAQSAQTEMQSRLAKKVQPLGEKIKATSEAIAQEKGGIFVFRKEALVHQVEDNNISDLVLKKLNLTPPANPVAPAERGNLKSSNKFGFFDVNTIMPKIPAFKQAESDMKTYQTQLQKMGEGMQKDLQKMMAMLDPNQNPNAGTLPEATKKAKMEEIRKQQIKMQEFQQTSNTQSQEKYNKLMDPIYKLLQEKITEYAKEQNITFVVKIEASLMEPSEQNISDAILKKFGVTPTEVKKN
jgi:outer membrane protein